MIAGKGSENKTTIAEFVFLYFAEFSIITTTTTVYQAVNTQSDISMLIRRNGNAS